MMGVHPKILLIDWDNTVIDSKSALVAGMDAVLNHGFQLPPPDIRLPYLGQSLKGGFPHLFGEKWREAAEIFKVTFLAHRAQKKNGQFEFLADAKETLTQLSANDYHLGILSNRETESLIDEADALGVRNLFFAICGSNIDAVRPDKPHRAHGEALLAMGGFADMLENQDKRQSIAMIGDSAVDMLLANNMQVAGILLDDGIKHENRELLTQCHYKMIRKWQEMPALLQELCPQ